MGFSEPASSGCCRLMFDVIYKTNEWLDLQMSGGIYKQMSGWIYKQMSDEIYKQMSGGIYK